MPIADAAELVATLLGERVRDDAKSPPLTRAGLKYARMKGSKAMDGNYKENLYLKMDSSLVHDPVKAPYRPKDVGKVLGNPTSGVRGAKGIFTRESINPRVQRVVAEVEQYLGDVIDADTSDDVASEECWTLCIDVANDLHYPDSVEVAKAACVELGYPR